MRHLYKAALLGLCLALFAVLPAIAQENPEPASGAPIIEANFGGDIATLNPIISDDGSSNDVIGRIYPSLIGIDPEIGYFAPDAKDGVAESWTISEDGLTYTFTLSDDWTWTDGTPITSADYLYTWEAIQDDALLANGNLLALKDLIASVEAPDPQTVVVTFFSPDCNSIDSAATLPLVPAHVFTELYGTDYSLMNDSDFNLNPSVTSGPFTFANFRPGEQVTTLANPDYPDALYGGVLPEGWVYKNVSDQTVLLEQFLAGELTWVNSVASARQQEFIDRAAAGEFQIYNAQSGTTRFIGLNLADPENPQDGLDENGEAVPQGNHPIMGDVRVRQALNYAINFEELNAGAFNGFGTQGATHSLPQAWAHNADIEPYPFDQAQAIALLEEAGWVDADGDGIRECDGCLYAEPGALLAFELLTNSGNSSQEALGTILQDQWGEVGFDVTFSPIDFNVLVETFQAQTYDAVMIFWGFGFPVDPDGISVTFAPENDVVAGGFNAVSYNNPRVNELLDQARALPGCDQAERKVLYDEVQQILHDEVPWIWIGTSTVTSVADKDLQNWDLRPTAITRWALDGWYKEAE